MLNTSRSQKSANEHMERKIKIKAEENAARVAYCIKHKINFISGTITPAQSNKYNNSKSNSIYVKDDIEKLDIGIKYMFNEYDKNVTLSIQPKYMGSRLNVYLFKDDHLNKSYAVSRNGFLVTRIPQTQLKHIYNELHERLYSFMEDKHVKMIIIDGEVLPWSLLGNDLIINDFLPVDKGLEIEIDFMKKYDFAEKIKHIHTTAVTDVVKGAVLKDLSSIHDEIKMQEMYDIYHRQMLLYANDKNDINDKNNENNVINYKPFGILKICFDDGTESIPLDDHTFSQSEMYSMLRNNLDTEDQLIIKIDETNYDDSFIKIKDYFDKLTYDMGYEGVVIKPDYVKKKKLHMMKCRNINYLTIIYGYDYGTESKIKRLVKSKSTSSKIKQSIKEYNLGIEMLKINYNDIKLEDNSKYMQIIHNLLFNEKVTSTLDPRL